ncbi:enoyl-CoA hydratase [Hyphococcus flavus]|uniref:Enoyl-CoA hydratase n=1 Tax=Hyphococcus flavus TaxID=1866326 RepID=A0AAE9ZA07_9PROT|nr:enoyl-CoA hydratase [Hyphococcus flavus]WDI30248.1 enoyl-CoA hydratase [Hyphococcus flavus]
MSDYISQTCDGAVLRLCFNRPDKKNAITTQMYAALADGLAQAQEDKSVRAVLFEGRGDFFTSGNDIGDFMSGAALADDAHGSRPVVRFLEAIATAEKPLIAAVNGPAVGVGVTMLFHCDLVYASEAAAFHTPFTDLAVVPEAASSLLLPRIAGHQRAAEMFILASKIDPHRAREFGFVNEVVAADALEEAALGAARSIAEKAPEAVRLTKQLMKGGREEVLERMKEEGEHFAAQLQSAEFREAGAAFLQKRKPDFSNIG